MEQNEAPAIGQETKTDESAVAAPQAADATETTEEQKDWKAEAAKWRRIAQKNGKEKPQKTLSEDIESKPAFSTDELIDNIAFIKDYSKDEIEVARRESQDLGVDMFKFLKSNSGKVHIEAYRAERKAKASTPSPSHRGVTFKGKSATEVMLDEKTSTDDKQAAWEATIRRAKGSNASI